MTEQVNTIYRFSKQDHTQSLVAASLIFSIFASDIPLMVHNLFLVVIWIPCNQHKQKRSHHCLLQYRPICTTQLLLLFFGWGWGEGLNNYHLQIVTLRNNFNKAYICSQVYIPWKNMILVYFHFCLQNVHNESIFSPFTLHAVLA